MRRSKKTVSDGLKHYDERHRKIDVEYSSNLENLICQKVTSGTRQSCNDKGRKNNKIE